MGKDSASMHNQRHVKKYNLVWRQEGDGWGIKIKEFGRRVINKIGSNEESLVPILEQHSSSGE
jgi:hypothetical protein